MSWTKPQIQLLQIVRRQLSWDDATYQLLLRNVAAIRPAEGKISSTHPHATQTGYERLLSFAESQGWQDRVHGAGYWTAKSRAACTRQHRLIHALIQLGKVHQLFTSSDPLPGFVGRMTLQREGGPTQVLEECGPVDTYNILEALKAWVFREASQKHIRIDRKEFFNV